ncbi:MAG TPA: hypothetical protein VFA41_18245 [Ktedonobacteraceae bacterium]|nr:hypothetical protein [Ktedonobacteraceae bacterium]
MPGLVNRLKFFQEIRKSFGKFFAPSIVHYLKQGDFTIADLLKFAGAA